MTDYTLLNFADAGGRAVPAIKVADWVVPLDRNGDRYSTELLGFAVSSTKDVLQHWEEAEPRLSALASELAARHTFDDTRKDSMSVGSDGPGSSTDYFPRVLNAFFGTKFKVVRGYKGSADITLAIERGEIDGLASWCYDCMKAQKQQWIAENRVRVLLQLALEGDPELDAQRVPKVIDLAKTKEERQAVQLAFSGVSIARPMVAPPGLTPALLATLRTALAKTVRDPELLEEARKGRNNIRFTPAERMEEVVARVYATDPALVQKVRDLMSH